MLQMRAKKNYVGNFPWLPLLLVVAASLCGDVQGRVTHIDYSPYPYLVELTPRNFDQYVTKSDDFWAVEFYAPWCHYCKQLAPEYIKTAENLQGQVKMGFVNCSKYPTLKYRYMLRGYPTIMMFGVDKDEPETYPGMRNAPAMMHYLTDFKDREERKRRR